jgi:uncharacterized protein with von Willebrand factor type A (vWA) domain
MGEHVSTHDFEFKGKIYQIRVYLYKGSATPVNDLYEARAFLDDIQANVGIHRIDLEILRSFLRSIHSQELEIDKIKEIAKNFIVGDVEEDIKNSEERISKYLQNNLKI